MKPRKNWTYYKPGDLLIRLRKKEEPVSRYENPYIVKAVSMGDQILTAPEILQAGLVPPKSDETPLILEVGCYKGTTLTALATENPHCRFLGIDIKYKRVVLTRLKLDKAGIDSQVKVAIIDLIDCLEILPPRSLQGICVFYPDPWKKQRFAERRLFSHYAMELITKCLSENGFIWLKTDHPEYIDRVSTLMDTQAFTPTSIPPAPIKPGIYPTDFEELFKNMKRELYEICLRKTDAAPSPC